MKSTSSPAVALRHKEDGHSLEYFFQMNLPEVHF
jgi:hypothetical protein